MRVGHYSEASARAIAGKEATSGRRRLGPTRAPLPPAPSPRPSPPPSLPPSFHLSLPLSLSRFLVPLRSRAGEGRSASQPPML